MSDILDLAARRRALIVLCESAGLVDIARDLGTKPNDDPGALRKTLLTVRHIATGIHAFIGHEHAGRPAPNLDAMAALALRIEHDAMAAIVVCDRVIAERHERNAVKIDQELAKSARHYVGRAQ